jgi:N-acetylmuramoyl-L-alanine amidase
MEEMPEPLVVDSPSPNHEARPPGRPVDLIVLHYTGMITGRAALERLRDPSAKVSAHYLIETDGTVHRLVPEARRAWHAGVAAWAGESDINDRSIGIELVNPGHEFGYVPFPEAQMLRLIDLCRAILGRHPIPSHRVLGHSDVAPARKQDPGELFDWARLADAGLGLWPLPAPRPDPAPGIAWFQEMLATIGYEVPRHGRLDAATQAVLTAFQRHFHPDAVTGAPDAETACRLEGLRRALEGRHAGP